MEASSGVRIARSLDVAWTYGPPWRAESPVSGFVRERASTCNDLRTLTASGPLIGAGASRSGLRTGSAPGPAQAPPPAR